MSVTTRLLALGVICIGIFRSAGAHGSGTIVFGNDKEGTRQTNCGNDVTFFPSVRETSMGYCYHPGGTWFDPCTGKSGNLGPNSVKSVTSQNPKEKQQTISALRIRKGDAVEPYSCNDGIRMTKDMVVKFDKPHIMKQSDVSVSPDGHIYNRATGKRIGTLPAGSWEKYDARHPLVQQREREKTAARADGQFVPGPPRSEL